MSDGEQQLDRQADSTQVDSDPSPHEGSQSGFDEQLTGELEGIVDDYKRGVITKFEAMRNLVNTLRDAAEEDDSPFPEQLLDPYFEQLEEHERSITEASKRGRRFGKDRQEEAETDENHLQQQPSKSKKAKVRRGHADEDDDSSKHSSEDESKDLVTSKRTYPWEATGVIHSAILTEMHIRVNNDIESFTEDISSARQNLLNTLGCPPFPHSEWTNILKGRAVNLDTVFSEMYSVSVEEHSTFSISETLSLKVGKPKQTTKITTHGEWAVAWAAYVRAMLFIFSYRQGELNEYQTHITNLFASQHHSVHDRVLNYDRAVRIFIGQQRSVLFNETIKYSHLKHAHIDSTGVAVVRGDVTSSAVEFSGGPTRRGKTTRQRRTREICRNHNAGKCRFTKEQCKYAHLCGNCGASGHTQDNCPNKGKHDA